MTKFQISAILISGGGVDFGLWHDYVKGNDILVRLSSCPLFLLDSCTVKKKRYMSRFLELENWEKTRYLGGSKFCGWNTRINSGWDFSLWHFHGILNISVWDTKIQLHVHEIKRKLLEIFFWSSLKKFQSKKVYLKQKRFCLCCQRDQDEVRLAGLSLVTTFSN